MSNQAKKEIPIDGIITLASQLIDLKQASRSAAYFANGLTVWSKHYLKLRSTI
jgi:hypothetical protein